MILTPSRVLVVSLSLAAACASSSPSSPPPPVEPLAAAPAPAPAPVSAEPVAAAAPEPPPPPVVPPQPPSPCVDPGDKDFSDAFDKATRLASDAPVTGCIGGKDADLFVMDVPDGAGGQLLQVELAGPGAPGLVLFDEKHAKKKRAEGAADGARTQVWAQVTGGSTIYLRVEQAPGASGDRYQLAATLTPLDEAEPNDDKASATPLPENGRRKGYFGRPIGKSGREEDWYAIDVTENGALAVEIQTEQDPKLTANLIGLDGKKFVARQIGAELGQPMRLETQAKKGRYWLQVSAVQQPLPTDAGPTPRRLSEGYWVIATRK